MEAKRVLGSRLFLAVLAGLLVLNCFFFLYQRPDTWEEPLVDGDVYHERLEALSDKSWEEALAWCVQYQEDASKAMFEEKWDFDSEAEEIRIAAGVLQKQYEHLLGYQDYLDGVQRYAKLLQSVSLFSQPGTFAYENTVKTARDFARMDGVEVTSGHDLAVTEFFADKWTDYSILILICVVCGLFVAERKEGLWPMVHAASGGRWRFALRRTLILLAAAWISTGILVGARVLLCGMEYHGLGEWGRTLQSIPMFHNVPIPMTIGQFWLFYITVKAMGAFMIGLVLWMMLSAISNIGLALCAAGLVLGVEFACMAIPSSSMFAPARYVNIFSYVDFTAVFTRYLNISVFGTLVAGSDLVLVILPFLCAVFIGWNLLIAQCKRPITRMNRLLKWLDWIAKKLSPYFARGGEICKLLIKRRGILLLILLVLVVQRFEAPPRAYVAWDPFIQFYQEKYAGPITMEKLALMEEDLATCMDMYNREGLQIVLDDAKSAPEGAWIVPSEPYDAIWSNNEENHHRNTALIAMLFLVLILAPIAAQERQNGMTVLLRSTSGGRKRLMLRKQLLLVALAAVVWALVYGTELHRTIEEYGAFSCLRAPAYSMTLFRDMGLSAPLGLTIGVYYGAKLLIMVAIGEVCYYLSSCCTKNRDAMLLCGGVLLIPAALAAIGSGIGEYLSFLLPLGGIELIL
ncbi:MAG: hypothetical protein IJV82_03500 [Oscillospiraceae bacterium]|nr:hypothetical protein [Oscillospiraceae bacterium]